MCAACQTAGHDWPAGEPIRDAAGHEQPSWLCPTCDEPAVDRFLPTCEWCGHAYDVEVDAAEVGDNAPAADRRPGSPRLGSAEAGPSAARETLGLVALLALVGAALAWFAWVVR